MKSPFARLPVFVLLLVCFIIPASSFARTDITYDEYLAEKARYAQQEKSLSEEIARLAAEIQTLKDSIRTIRGETASEWEAIYSMLGVTAEDNEKWLADLTLLSSDVDDLGQAPPDEIYRRAGELDKLEARLEELRSDPLAALFDNRQRLLKLEAKTGNIRSRIPKPRKLEYTVIRGDYLWKIAGMKEHYGDPMKWMRIYSVNADQIADPDLIFPEQRFVIPIDIDRKTQYLVAKGDFLSAIAENRFGDPFMWRKLYDANSSFIKDPDKLFPEMILTLPGN